MIRINICPKPIKFSTPFGPALFRALAIFVLCEIAFLTTLFVEQPRLQGYC